MILCSFYLHRRPNEAAKRKPEVVVEYNKYMLGVDKLGSNGQLLQFPPQDY